MLLPQTFDSWSKVREGMEGGRLVAILITLLLAFSLVMLVRIAWSGVIFDVQPASPTKNGGTKLQTTAKPGNPAKTPKHP
jgi:hypothetical protein